MNEEEEEIPVNITNDLERRVCDTFQVFDVIGNKTVDSRELGNVIRALGCCPTEAEIQEILLAVEDPKRPGSVHMAHFMPHMCKLLMENKYQPATPDELLKAFHQLDPENRGYITKEEITSFITENGEPFTEEELEEMLLIAVDPQTQTIPYEYYINQLMWEPEGEKNIYTLAARILRENPPPPPPTKKRMSAFFEELGNLQL